MSGIIGHRGLLLAGASTPPGGVPTFQAAGAQAAGQTLVNVSWPTHLAGDYGLLLWQTQNEVPGVLSGWTQIAQLGTGTPGAGGATMLTLYERFAASASEPTVALPDPGNHTVASILTFRGVNVTTPVDVSATGSGSGTAIVLPSVTTTGAQRLIVCAVGDSYDNNSTTRYSGWANANLVSITEVADGGTTNGNGGGIGCAVGEKATAGATGAGAVTFVTSGQNWVALTLALSP